MHSVWASNVAGIRLNRYRMPDKSTEVFTIWSSRPKGISAIRNISAKTRQSLIT